MPPVKDPEQTRQAILNAAFTEIHHHGFQGARLDRLLPKLGLTKGALYHHFPDKNAVGFAIIDEILAPEYYQKVIEPLSEMEDPIEALKEVVRRTLDVHLGTKEYIAWGCPCFNLIQEMSPLDEDFRRRLDQMVEERRQAIARSLKTGVRKGYIRRGLKPLVVADFFIASLQGILATGMLNRDREQLVSVSQHLSQYLETLRA